MKSTLEKVNDSYQNKKTSVSENIETLENHNHTGFPTLKFANELNSSIRKKSLNQLIYGKEVNGQLTSRLVEFKYVLV